MIWWEPWFNFAAEFRKDTAEYNTAVKAMKQDVLTPLQQGALHEGYYKLFVHKGKEWFPSKHLPLGAEKNLCGLDAAEWEAFVHRVQVEKKAVTLEDLMALDSEGSAECPLTMMSHEFVTNNYDLVRFVHPEDFPGHTRESLIELVPDLLAPLVD